MTTTSPPRRNWHFTRWLIVFIVAVFGWGGWRAYAFRSALAEARALGWQVEYTDPVKTIRKRWKAAFKKETWLDGVKAVRIPTSEEFEQHLAIVRRLNPKGLQIYNAATLRDLSALKALTRLQSVSLGGCTGLTTVDALKNLSALQYVSLSGCTGLTNVDGLKNLSALQRVSLTGCTGLTNLDALKHLPALQSVRLGDCTGLTNVNALKNLSALQGVGLDGCTGLTTVDALKNLSALQYVSLSGCTGLTNVDGLKNLSALEGVWLTGCTVLTKDSVAALKAALPKALIYGP